MVIESDVLGVEEADKIKETFISFLQSEDATLRLNLCNVNKIDLCAVQLILSLKKSLDEENRTLLLINCTNSVIDAFKLVGCFTLLECRDE